MIQVTTTHLYVILAILELALVLTGVSLILLLWNRRYRTRIATLENALREARSRYRVIREKALAEAAIEKGYLEQLETQIKSSRALLGEDVFEHLHPPSGEETEDRQRLLAIRHRFLELEHHAQLVQNDPRARETHWKKGIEDLLSRVFPEPVRDHEDGGSRGAPGMESSREMRTSIAMLHNALHEQRGVITELRTLLETELADSDQTEEILQRVEQAEAQTQEIESLLARIENRSGEDADGEHVPDSDQLRTLVGNQQDTIAQLESMLQGAMREEESPEELESLLNKIQRTNMELGTCVTVLEDENARLRDEIAALQDRVAELEKTSEPQEEAVSDRGTEEPDQSPVMEDTADREQEIDGRASDALEDRIEPPEEIDLDEEAGDGAEVTADNVSREPVSADGVREQKTGTDDAAPPPSPPRPGWTNDL